MEMRKYKPWLGCGLSSLFSTCVLYLVHYLLQTKLHIAQLKKIEKIKFQRNWVSLSSSVTRSQVLGLCIHCSAWVFGIFSNQSIIIWHLKPYFIFVVADIILFFFLHYYILIYTISWFRWLLVGIGFLSQTIHPLILLLSKIQVRQQRKPMYWHYHSLWISCLDPDLPQHTS